jgi:hypothetical protein
VFALRDALEQVGVVLEGADMGPGDLVRRVPEVVGASAFDPMIAFEAAHSSSSSGLIVRPMNASFDTLSQRKINPMVLFFDLTSRWLWMARASMIIWFVLPR